MDLPRVKKIGIHHQQPRCSFGRQDQGGDCKNVLVRSVMRAADLTGAARAILVVPWVDDLFDSPNLSLKKKLSRCVHTRVLGNCHAEVYVPPLAA